MDHDDRPKTDRTARNVSGGSSTDAADSQPPSRRSTRLANRSREAQSRSLTPTVSSSAELPDIHSLTLGHAGEGEHPTPLSLRSLAPPSSASDPISTGDQLLQRDEDFLSNRRISPHNVSTDEPSYARGTETSSTPSVDPPSSNLHRHIISDHALTMIFPLTNILTRLPRSNIEAIYIHQTPIICDEQVGTGDLREETVPPREPSSTRGSRPRPSAAPLPPGGSSSTSTDKRTTLESIMKSDPELRAHGIRVAFDNAIHIKLDQRLRQVLRVHEDPQFLSEWCCDLLTEERVFRDEFLTNEPTTTGVYRSTMYGHCNHFTSYSKNFTTNPNIVNSKWGDPPTTVVSMLDVGCWCGRVCRRGAEHKRQKVCGFDHFSAIQTSASSRPNADEYGIHIFINNEGKLAFKNLLGRSELYTKVQLLLVQVSPAECDIG